MKDDCGDTTLIRTIIPARLDDPEFLKQWGFTSTSCCLCKLDIRNTGGRLLQCARCKLAHYCTLACLQADFAKHKEVCILAHEANLKFLEEAAAAGPRPATIEEPSSSLSTAKGSKATPRRQLPEINGVSPKGKSKKTSKKKKKCKNKKVCVPDLHNGEAATETHQDCSESESNCGDVAASNPTAGLLQENPQLSDNDNNIFSKPSEMDSRDSLIEAKNRESVLNNQSDKAHIMNSNESQLDGNGTSFNAGDCGDCATSDSTPGSLQEIPQVNDNADNDAIFTKSNNIDEMKNHPDTAQVMVDNESLLNDDGRSFNVGKLDSDRMPQFSPNTHRKLASVGKLPSSCIAAFDDKRPVSSYQNNKSKITPTDAAAANELSKGHFDSTDSQSDSNHATQMNDDPFFNARNVGKLGDDHLPQHSPNTHRHLLSVGKLPGSCVDVFDGKQRPLSYNKLQGREHTNPNSLQVVSARVQPKATAHIGQKSADQSAHDTILTENNAVQSSAVHEQELGETIGVGKTSSQSTDTPINMANVGKLPNSCIAAYDEKRPVSSYQSNKPKLSPIDAAADELSKRYFYTNDPQSDSKCTLTPTQTKGNHCLNAWNTRRLGDDDLSQHSPNTHRRLVSVGNLPESCLPQPSPNSHRHLLSVGKLPESCVEVFDGKQRPLSYNRFQGREPTSPNSLQVVSARVQPKVTGENSVDLSAHDTNIFRGNNDTPSKELESVETIDVGDIPSTFTDKPINLRKENGSSCKSPPSPRQVGKLQPVGMGTPPSGKIITAAPGKLSVTAVQTFNGGRDSENSVYQSRGCMRSPKQTALNVPIGSGHSRPENFKHPDRLNHTLVETFDSPQKDRTKIQLATVDHLSSEAIDCFEKPVASPRRPLRSPGKLPSFAMRAFSPRTPDQNKLPPAFSRLKPSPLRKWKVYKPKEVVATSSSDQNNTRDT